LPDRKDKEKNAPEEPLPVILKGVRVAGQAEKLVKARREITRIEEMTRLEQIEHETKIKTDDILNKAKADAEALIAAAKNEADGIRKNARTEGDREAKREALERVAGLISDLENEIQSLRRIRADFLKSNMEGLMEFACKVAGKVLVSELHARPEAIAERAAELLTRIPIDSKIVLVTSSEDIDVIERYLDEAGGPADALRTSLRADPSMPQGSLRLESDAGIIDANLIDSLENIGSLLGDQARHFQHGEWQCPEGEDGG
jgi:flagellar assembly protein FliH/type III secretion protein L